MGRVLRQRVVKDRIEASDVRYIGKSFQRMPHNFQSRWQMQRRKRYRLFEFLQHLGRYVLVTSQPRTTMNDSMSHNTGRRQRFPLERRQQVVRSLARIGKAARFINDTLPSLSQPDATIFASESFGGALRQLFFVCASQRIQRDLQ